MPGSLILIPITPGTVTLVTLNPASTSFNTATDTSVLQTLLNGGGTVWLGPGTFTVTGLTVPSGTVVRGSGRAVTTIKLADNTNQILLSCGTGKTNITVADLTLDGNRANNTSGYALWASSPTRLTVENLSADSVAGVLLTGTPVSCTVRNVTSTGVSNGAGIECDADTVIAGCVVNSMTAPNHIWAGSGCRVANCHVTGTSGSQNGIRAAADNVMIDGNIVDFTGLTGSGACINVAYNANGCRVVNNRTIGSSCGIQIGGAGAGAGVARTCSSNVVANNTVSGANADGILLGIDHTIDTGVDNLVSGNTVFDCNGSVPASGQMGIGIESQLARTTVSGNTCRNCDDHGIALYGDYSSATGNICKGNNQVTTGGGIKVASSFAAVTGNTSIDNGTSSVAADGILVQSEVADITSFQIVGNVCTDTRASASKTQVYGIRMLANNGHTPDKGYIYSNLVAGNKTGTVSTTGTGSLTGSNN